MDQERLTEDLAIVRRAFVGDMLTSLTRATGDVELTVTQLATLNILRSEHVPTVKELAERLGRSVSATSRLIDQLARRGWVHRREDPTDRRAKRVTLTDAGTDFVRGFELARARVQVELLETMTPSERQLVLAAMALLAKAAKGKRDV